MALTTPPRVRGTGRGVPRASTLLPKSGGIMESDWSQGYVTEVLYTEHFFRELSPAWLNYVATINGCQPRRLDPGFT